MSEGSVNASALAYREPDIVIILVLTSFLLLLNFVNSLVDRLIYAGLLGQILIGIAFGTPGAKWLDSAVEETVVNLGYLGLILLVYEGGLSTSFQSLKANLALSSAIAVTGIAFPIGLSFALRSLIDASPLQSFAAGAALCSTSLGTTFTVLQTSGLSGTRISVVLTSAAVIDDVFGLVMVQVVANLSLGSEHLNGVNIVRPILVALGLGLATIIVCRFIVLRLTVSLNNWRERTPQKHLFRWLLKEETSLIVHLAILIAIVTGATYAGTSGLFAAYLGGTAISWWDAEVPHLQVTALPSRIERCAPSKHGGNPQTPERNAQDPTEGGHSGYLTENNRPKGKEEPTNNSSPAITVGRSESICGTRVYEKYLRESQDRVFKPFFFASIGFSIPITRMFAGEVVWRGMVYAMLMFVGKFMCGLWLVRLPIPSRLGRLWPDHIQRKASVMQTPVGQGSDKPGAASDTSSKDATSTPEVKKGAISATPGAGASAESDAGPTKPLSLYPAMILGSAMVARGEIGFLISSVADASGVFGQLQGPIFLIVTWAIVLFSGL